MLCGYKLHGKGITRKSDYTGGGGTKYIGKVLNRKRTIRKRDDIEKRLHGERVYI